MKKDIYFYWGNDTMSYMRYMTLHSFCYYNPDWTVNLIKNTNPELRVLVGTEEKQDSTEFRGKDCIHLLDNLDINIIPFDSNMLDLPTYLVKNMSDVHIKDMLNWKLLANEGGIVADMDILFTKPLGDNVDTYADIGIVCFNGNPQKDYIPVSFMYSSGKNRFFEATYRNAIKNYNPKIYESCGTLCIKESNLDEIENDHPDLIVQKLNDAIVFPFIDYTWSEGIDLLYRSTDNNLLHKDSVGIHWYGGAPQSQRVNNMLDEDMLNYVNNIFTNKIKEIL